MNKLILPVGVTAGILVIVGLIFSNSKSTIQSNQISAQNTSVTTRNDATNEKNEQSGTYVEYSETNLSQATQDGKAVIFFHASWCSTCRAADKSITSNLSSIPENLTILKTDYDSQTALKKKYGVTSQHAFVQVDAQGEMITKWSGGDLSTIIARVK